MRKATTVTEHIPPLNQLSIHTLVLYCLTQVAGFDAFGAFEVGDGVRHFEYAGVSAEPARMAAQAANFMISISTPKVAAFSARPNAFLVISSER